MKTPVKPITIWVLAAVLATEIVLVGLYVRVDFPFLAPALLGAVVVQIRTCRSRLELLGTVLLAVLLGIGRGTERTCERSTSILPDGGSFSG